MIEAADSQMWSSRWTGLNSLQRPRNGRWNSVSSGFRSLKKCNRYDPARHRSIGEHGQCGPAVSRLQPKKQRAGFLDILFGTTLGGRLEGNRSRMIRSTDESQSFSQAPHGCTVDLCLFHSGVPKYQPVSLRRSVSGMVTSAAQLNAPDTVCPAVTRAPDKRTLAHPGRATASNCSASITFIKASSNLPINFSHRGPKLRELRTCCRHHQDGKE